MAVFRYYVEKRPLYAVEADGLLEDIQLALRIPGVSGVRIINRYDVENVSTDILKAAEDTIFSEPQVDNLFTKLCPGGDCRTFAVEYLPGQFDQRADSCAQCIQLLTQGERPAVKTARVYLLEGRLSDGEFERIKEYLINPVEAREASLELPATLAMTYAVPGDIPLVEGFIGMDRDELKALAESWGLAMDLDDLLFCQDYFRDTENRNPTETEIRVIDTYWSDHCRHTTFLTRLEEITVEPAYVKNSLERYMGLRRELYGERTDRPVTLMDLATIGAKYLRREGYLEDLDDSEEINACSIKIKVDVDGEKQDWLLMFKNETHNHPTEIEPFGGAATCLGGAIRDPLSGRSYVYQAMRITGAGDPTAPVEATLPGKLPQRKLVTTAADGYSSYGNQIGLATGHVCEIYHPGYIAKRMEIGAVVGAAPAANVRRERPAPGDAVLLIGGRTGRDGCGGATGSSKAHTAGSLESCGAEVQKGNPPEERKLQRFFRNPEAAHRIKRCNDFGAGGVSVAIGELADGLIIDLDAVPKKYEGLSGTELAISESQERMAVVVADEDAEALIRLAEAENLDAVRVASVTREPRLTMMWRGRGIVGLSRDFLNSNGAVKKAEVYVPEIKKPAKTKPEAGETVAEKWKRILSDLNVCSQKGLVERFDSTIGAGTLLMPFGGKYQLTPTQAMAAKIPVQDGETTTCSVMSWGFDPWIAQQSPYHGGVLAVVQSVARMVAAGAGYKGCRLTFQEYFERTRGIPERWGKPFAALLGALEAQIALKLPAIGGKDSMSGSFEELDVPPTLVSFAVAPADARGVISPEFKGEGNGVYLLLPQYDENGLPDFDSLLAVLDEMDSLIRSGRAQSVWAIGYGGVAEAVSKMAFGNGIGMIFDKELPESLMYGAAYGGFVFEADGCEHGNAQRIGATVEHPVIAYKGEEMELSSLLAVWQDRLEPVYPSLSPSPSGEVPVLSASYAHRVTPVVRTALPRVLIPVFPGTNCECDTARAFRLAGGSPEVFVMKNRTPGDIDASAREFARLAAQAQIIALPGGFSAGDEPDGSGKFITSFFRNPIVSEAVAELLSSRDGLMCGICNGFQALIKLGLVPYGEIRAPRSDSPTLAGNAIGRFQSVLVRTRVASNKSPWLMYAGVGDIHTIPLAHGEGRFVADRKIMEQLAANGQIATQYVDDRGIPTMDIRYNPNGSYYAVEGITSPDGRILGKMAHSERYGNRLYLNVDGEKEQNIFRGAVDYFAK